VEHFTGVIIPWGQHLEHFDRMALEHGVAVWWCDYIPDGSTSERAPWHGLSGEGCALPQTHRGTGYIYTTKNDTAQTHIVKVDTSGASRSFLDVIVSRKPVDSSRFELALPPASHFRSHLSGPSGSSPLPSLPPAGASPVRERDGNAKRARVDMESQDPKPRASAAINSSAPSKKRKLRPTKRQREAKREALKLKAAEA